MVIISPAKKTVLINTSTAQEILATDIIDAQKMEEDFVLKVEHLVPELRGIKWKPVFIGSDPLGMRSAIFAPDVGISQGRGNFVPENEVMDVLSRLANPDTTPLLRENMFFLVAAYLGVDYWNKIPSMEEAGDYILKGLKDKYEFVK